MASGDFELTIVISAIDDASAVFQTVAGEIAQDFGLISEQSKSAEADIDSALGVFSSFDSSLVALQQDALATLQSLDQLTTAIGSAMNGSDGGGGSMSGFGFLSGDVNPLSVDLSGFSSQQGDVLNRLAGAIQAGPSSVQLVQNNTFNGILDPGAIRDQVIPELERAVTRGATLLATT